MKRRIMMPDSNRKPHLFGTDGIRGEYGKTLNKFIAYRVGRYIGYSPINHRYKIAIGRDTRYSGKYLFESLKNGILNSGGDVYDLGVTTTPSISYVVRNHNLDYGIMISASHNPYTDNGIKIFAKDGSKIDESLEVQIEDYIENEKDELEIKLFDRAGVLSTEGTKFKDEYICFLKSFLHSDLDGLNIILDLANGSASSIAPIFFKDLKAKVTFINDSPDGKNINFNAGSTHLEGLINKVKEGHYDMGFAFDGDADRLLAVNHDGKVIDGDMIMYLLAISLKEENKLNDDTIVITKMSNLGLKKALAKKGIKVLEVDVGDKYVQRTLKENNLLLGGEQSGHIIQYDKLMTGDGFLTLVAILNELAKHHGNLDDVFDEIKIYPQLLINYRYQSKDKDLLSLPDTIKIIELMQDKLGDDGRLFIRKSGTEPLIRIMCEAKSDEQCQEVCEKVLEVIRNEDEK